MSEPWTPEAISLLKDRAGLSFASFAAAVGCTEKHAFRLASGKGRYGRPYKPGRAISLGLDRLKAALDLRDARMARKW